LSSHASQRTDADIVGVRFPFRNEFHVHGCEPDDIDDRKLCCEPSKPSFVIVEVKRSEIALNDAWTSCSKGNENINEMISALGVLGGKEKIKIKEVSDRLHEAGQFNDKCYYWSFVLVGNSDVGKVPSRYKLVPRILWSDICRFIHKRFSSAPYAKLKGNNQQWDCLGKTLYELANKNKADFAAFEKEVRQLCALPPNQT
jgi:hypothetical protein